MIYFYKIQVKTRLTYSGGNQDRDLPLVTNRIWWEEDGDFGGTKEMFYILPGVVDAQMCIVAKTDQTVHLLRISTYANQALMKNLN